MKDPKPIFKSPYDLKDVSVLFLIVAFVLIFSAIIGNNLFGVFQENIKFGWKMLLEKIINLSGFS